MIRVLQIAAGAALLATSAQAATISPVSYDMLNGESGSFNYWDDAYTGAGNNQANLAALSGGLGDLTDGVIATGNWNVVEGPAGPNGPYVGWASIDPTITFRFATAHDFDTVTFHFDDSNGTGGVTSPASVSVNGVFGSVTDPAGGAPFAYTLDVSSLASTDTLVVDVARRGGSWVFLSEVTFDDGIAPVPLPAGGALLLAALAGLPLLRRRG